MTDYYPYGTPMQSSTGAEVNRYKYGGKEFETESGLNHYDFEARTLIPQTCLFSTPDPKAGDYPGLNPYLYCAANPLKYIDPSGKKLHAIFAGNDDIFEINYNDDRNLALYDNRGNEISEDSYSLSQSILMDALDYLCQSETASTMLQTIIQSDKSVKINMSNVKQNSFNEIGTVNWNPNITNGGISKDPISGNYTTKRQPAIGLAHELAHSEDWVKNGSLNSNIYSSGEYFSDKQKVSLSYAEFFACGRENMIRSDLKQPLRTHYSYHAIHLNGVPILIPHPHSYLLNINLDITKFFNP